MARKAGITVIDKKHAHRIPMETIIPNSLIDNTLNIIKDADPNAEVIPVKIIGGAILVRLFLDRSMEFFSDVSS